MKVYLVGGAVRDQLLGIKPKENDYVVVGSTPKEMLKLGYRQVGKSFPVFLHPETNEEYALARKEKKVAPGYQGFTFEFAPTITLEEDLERRDLTINAMAKDGDKIIDPYGGQADLKAKVIRHVSEHFVEDPLRVLRACRFAAEFGFSIASETQKLIKQLVASGEVETLSSERILMEFEKATAYKSLYPFLTFLKQFDCFEKLNLELDDQWEAKLKDCENSKLDTEEQLAAFFSFHKNIESLFNSFNFSNEMKKLIKITHKYGLSYATGFDAETERVYDFLTQLRFDESVLNRLTKLTEFLYGFDGQNKIPLCLQGVKLLKFDDSLSPVQIKEMKIEAIASVLSAPMI